MLKIDCHTHVAHAETGPDGKLIPPLRLAWQEGECTVGDYLESSLKEGIDRIVVLDCGDITFAARETFGEYVIPVPMVNLDRDDPKDVDLLFQRGAVGIKFMAPRANYGDERYWPFYDAVKSHGGLATFHTGFLGLEIYEPGGLHQWGHHVDITNMRPAATDRVARVFPDLKIVIAHFGNPWWEEAFCILRAHKNVYADFSGGSCLRRPLDFWSQLFAPNGKLDTKAIQKLCYGTDAIYCQQANDYSAVRSISDFYEAFMERVAVPPEIQQMIYRESILGLTASGITG